MKFLTVIVVENILCKLATFEFQVQIFKWNTCSNSRCTYKTDAPRRRPIVPLSLSLILANDRPIVGETRMYYVYMYSYIPLDTRFLFLLRVFKQFSHAKAESLRILFELKNIVMLLPS